MKLSKLYVETRCENVIDSCETPKQIEMAKKYCEISCDRMLDKIAALDLMHDLRGICWSKLFSFTNPPLCDGE